MLESASAEFVDVQRASILEADADAVVSPAALAVVALLVMAFRGAITADATTAPWSAPSSLSWLS